MLKKILLIVIIWLIIPHNLVYGQTSSSIDQLDALSDKALEMTKLKRYEDSEKMLSYFSDLFLQDYGRKNLFLIWMNCESLQLLIMRH